MNRRVNVRFAGAVLAAVVWLLVPWPAAWAQLQVHEVLGDPASDWDGDGEIDFKGDEWVEIINIGDQAVTLDDIWLKDALGDDPHMRLSGELAAGAILVVYGSEVVVWQSENGAGSSGLSLNNGGDTVYIMQGPAPDQLVEIDSVLYLDHEAEDDRASGRHIDGGTWMLFDALNPYDGLQDPLTTLCLPSPGEPNDCVPLVPAEGRTWGEVKELFER